MIRLGFGDWRLPAKIWSWLVVSSGGCWVWTGSRTTAGYGHVRHNNSLMYLHRITWAANNGSEIPKGLEIDHVCRNRSCCNPEHLRAVTHRENMLAPGARGMARRNAEKTYCPSGHPYDAENTKIRANGNRQCRTCVRERRERNSRRPKSVARALAVALFLLAFPVGSVCGGTLHPDAGGPRASVSR